MDISSYSSSFANSGSLGSVTPKQLFGAQTVSSTLDYLNGTTQPSSVLGPTDKQTFGAAVVSKTLDYLNSSPLGAHSGGGLSDTYNLSQSVLGAYTTGKGALANLST